jgi:hypothetical protein
VRFEVLTAVKMTMLFFWVVTSTLKMETECVSETFVSTYESPHGVTTQKYTITVRTATIFFFHRNFACDLKLPGTSLDL